ncbi:hypothetical protein, partial [Salsipaludibacter albus]|uniref:hypothetical protein n=1 Tax=Salsipaludibacter albus TaxID=2849650 RepID=UPI001EE43867
MGALLVVRTGWGAGRRPVGSCGWRGAGPYYSPAYRAAFDLECRALARVRGDLGLDNVIIMVPF